MPLDFPANPTNGQIYGSYVYNSTTGAWQAREDSRTVAILSSTVPSSANPGDIWVNTNDGISFVYYNDGTSAQWMELLPSGVPLLNTKTNLIGDNTFSGGVNYFGPNALNGTFISSNTGRAQFSVNIASGTPLMVRGFTSQTGDLQQWQDSTSAVISKVDASGSITAPRFISTQTTGTAPMTVASTTVVTNLNADLLDGNHFTAFAPAAGSTNIVTLGTVTSGKWQGSAIDVAYGGTGTNTLTSGAYLKGNGANGIVSQTGIPAGDITSGSLDIARGGTGSTSGSGLIPIIPSSVTLGSGTSSVSANGTVTFTGATSISLNSVFSSSYRHYRLVLDTPTVSANGNVFIRFRNGTTDDTTGVYYQYWTMKRLNGTTQDNTGGPSTGYSLYGFITNTNVYYAWTGDIMSPNISTTQSIVQGRGFGQDATTTYAVDSTVLFNTTRSFDGITIYTGGPQMTGTVKILGYL